MKFKIIKYFLVITFAITFLGCNHVRATYTDADKAIDKTKTQVQNDTAKADQIASAVKMQDKSFADTKPLTLEEQALWLKNEINVNGRNLPFAFLVSRILRDVSVPVKYDPSVKKNQVISLDYNGTIQGALDELSDRTGYAYVITEDGVLWTTLVTKTFNIAFMPGTSTYLVGGSSSVGGGGSSNNNSSGGGATNSSTSTNQSTSGSNTGGNNSGGSNINDSQYTTLQGSLSVWDDLRNTLDSLKSKDGKVFVSQSTTSVTATDHPSNIAEMGRYIDQLNKTMSRQVKLQAQVLEIDLNKDHAYGVDWNLFRSVLGSQIGISGALGTAVKVGDGEPMAIQLGNLAGSNAVIQALSSQGKVSVVTEPSAVTMNNQVAEIRISHDTAYMQSITQNVQGNPPVTSTSYNPATVSEGFTLYLLPKIQDNQIYLQISSTLASLLGIQQYGSGAQEIQLPVFAEKHFNMRSLVNNGETLVIGGFKQVRNETREQKPFGLKALGGEGAESKDSETIILITPTIIENKD